MGEFTLKFKRLCEKVETGFREHAGLSPRGVFFFRKDFLIRNFGDELSPVLVRHVLKLNYNLAVRDLIPTRERRLFAIGSILHFANSGDVVWGSGINGKVEADAHKFDSLDVRAVRGPKTRAFLLSRGISCPEIYGDPALLLPRYFKKQPLLRRSKRDYIVLPNYNDLPLFSEEKNLSSPLGPLRRILGDIANSRLVISSSLHGIILAEAYGVPAVLLLPPGHGEHIFKYEDYYWGTGRDLFPIASSLDEAKAAIPPKAPDFDAQALIDAFPLDFYRSSHGEA